MWLIERNLLGQTQYTLFGNEMQCSFDFDMERAL